MVYECGLRLAERSKSGGPSLGRSPDAHKQRRPVNQKSNPNFRENRVDTIFGAGLNGPALFYCIAFSSEVDTGSREENASKKNHRNNHMPSPNPIQQSFELAAERCEDLTPLVYRRLFREHPEALAMFRTDGSELVKGSMLALTIEAVLDFAGERSGNFRMIECELTSHDAYGTPRELFVAFFGVIAASLREVLGDDWSPEIDQAWQRLLGEIAGVVARSEA